MFRISNYVLAAVASCAISGFAVAADATHPADADSGANSLRAAINPTTGKLTQPSAAQMQKLKVTQVATAKGIKRPATEQIAVAQTKHLRDGGYAVQLSNDRLSSIVATRGADGKLHMSEQNGDTLNSQANLDAANTVVGVAQ